MQHSRPARDAGIIAAPQSAAVEERNARSTATVALCFAVAVLEGFDIQAIGVAAPRLAPELGLNPDQMGWVFAISNVGLVFGATLGGWLADRMGRRPVFVAAVVTFGAFTLLTSMVSGYDALLAVRLLAGLGFGAALPNMMAIAAEISASARPASTAAAMFCGMPLGGGTSALLTQLLPRDFDWRVLFIAGGTLPLLLAPLLHWRMPETLRPRARNVATRSSFETLFGEGRAGTTILLWLAFFPTLLILYLVLNWLPTLVIAKGLDRAVAPQASLAFNFASVAGALLLGRAVDRFGARGPLSIAYAALIATLIALGASSHHTAILVLSGLAGFLLLGANYALYGVAPACYPASARGMGSGASVAIGRIGSIAGPLVAGMLLGSGATATNVVQYMAPVAAIAGVAAFMLGRFFRGNPIRA
jgi:MFS transporter, AAHS family, 3-hydroxyphenylpropionic acid transporter